MGEISLCGAYSYNLILFAKKQGRKYCSETVSFDTNLDETGISTCVLWSDARKGLLGKLNEIGRGVQPGPCNLAQ